MELLLKKIKQLELITKSFNKYLLNTENISSHLKNNQELYLKFANFSCTPVKKRILIINPDCYIFESLYKELERAKIPVLNCRISNQQNDNDLFKIIEAIKTYQPAYILLRNRIGLDYYNPFYLGIIESLCQKNKITYLSWWLDIPTLPAWLWLTNNAQDEQHCFHSSNLATKFKAFTNCQHLLPGATPLVYEGQTSVEQHTLSLVGQSRVNECFEYLNNLISIVNSLNEAPLTSFFKQKNCFQEILKHTAEFKKKALATQKNIAAAPTQYFFSYNLNLLLSALNRINVIRHLNSRDIIVYGDPDWLKQGIIKKAQYKGLIALDKVKGVYQNSSINIHSNFAQVAGSICPKIFDVFATKSFILTESSNDYSLLDPQQITAFSSFKELDLKIEQFLTSPKDKKELTLSFYNEVRKKHLLRQRLEKLLNMLKY